MRKSDSRPPRVAVTMYLLRQARCAGADWHAPDDWKRKLLRLSTDRPTSPACFYWWHGPTRAGSRFRRMQTTTDRLGSSPFRSMKSGWQDHLLFCPPQICFRSSTKSASKLGMAQTTPDRAKSRNSRGGFPIFGNFQCLGSDAHLVAVYSNFWCYSSQAWRSCTNRSRSGFRCSSASAVTLNSAAVSAARRCSPRSAALHRGSGY